MISIPEHDNEWFKKPVKIILLAMEPSHEVNPPKTTDWNRFTGTISLTEEPLEFQNGGEIVMGKVLLESKI